MLKKTTKIWCFQTPKHLYIYCRRSQIHLGKFDHSTGQSCGAVLQVLKWLLINLTWKTSAENIGTPSQWTGSFEFSIFNKHSNISISKTILLNIIKLSWVSVSTCKLCVQFLPSHLWDQLEHMVLQSTPSYPVHHAPQRHWSSIWRNVVEAARKWHNWTKGERKKNSQSSSITFCHSVSKLSVTLKRCNCSISMDHLQRNQNVIFVIIITVIIINITIFLDSTLLSTTPKARHPSAPSNSVHPCFLGALAALVAWLLSHWSLVGLSLWLSLLVKPIREMSTHTWLKHPSRGGTFSTSDL